MRISGKISCKFQDFMQIIRFSVRFPDYARFSDFNKNFMENFQISMKISARFSDSSVDFDILILNFRMM